MSTIKKILMAASAVVVLGLGGFLASEHFSDSEQGRSTDPGKIVADYQDLLNEAERLKALAGENCDNKKDVNRRIEEMEKKLADLADRKKAWLDNVPKLPDIDPETIIPEDPRGRPGSEVPELSSDAPPLPDIDMDSIIVEERPGSQVPELSSDVPPLPDINPVVIDDEEFIPDMPEINPGRPGSEVPELSSDAPPLPDINPVVIDDEEFIPDMPEINPGRPGSEIPELSSDVPPLPDINEADIINPDEDFYQMGELERKIGDLLQELKALCKDEEKKKVISDKCSDACQRHKDCAAYTEDVTPGDLNDAYDACMEECPAWPKEMIKCINAIDIKTPNDCVSFVNCQVPQFFEEKYLE